MKDDLDESEWLGAASANPAFDFLKGPEEDIYTGASKKRAKGDPAALQLTGESLVNFVGEEAPVARAGPRSPDVFYRGEEAGAALKTYFR